MAIGSVLLGLALLILVGLFLARPLLKPAAASNPFSDRHLQLEREKESYINEIKALDFDHETGKVPTEIYEQQRAQLVAAAAAILEEQDKLPSSSAGGVYDQIEAAVAARRHQHAVSGNGQTDYCSQCGQPLDAGDKFCSRCGQPIAVTAPST